MPEQAGRLPDRTVARPAADPAVDGWGSPVPAEYGSLRATRAPRSAYANPASSARSTRGSASNSSVLALFRRLQGGGSPRGKSDLRAKSDPRGKSDRNGSGHKGRNGKAVQGAIAEKAAAATSTVAGAAAAATSTVAGAAAAATSSVRSLLAPSPESAPSTEFAPSPASAPAPVAPAPIEAPLSAAPGVVPTAGLPPGPAPAVRPTRSSRRERREEAFVTAQRSRSRATVRHIDIWTVIKVSVVFYLIAALVIVAAALLLWYAADAFGTLPSLEKSVRTLFGLKSFKVHAGAVLGYTTLAGLVLTVTGAIANILAALVYNLISDAVGGIRVELEAPRRRPG